MRQRKISRAQIERAVQRPDSIYESWGKLVAESTTSAGNTVFVYHVYTGPRETLVLSVKRRKGTSQGGPTERI